jgi:hypothetical protein
MTKGRGASKLYRKGILHTPDAAGANLPGI